MYGLLVTPADETFDRRIRRSRNALRDAVLELVTERPYDKITVADILRRADVSRGTFYSHYADRDALFIDATDQLTDGLIEAMVAGAAKETAALTGEAVRTLFCHAFDHRATYRSMLDGAAGGAPLRRYVARLTEAFAALQAASVRAVGSPPNMPLDALARAWVGEQLALTAWWLEGDTGLEVNDLTRMRMQLMTQGPTWAYGLKPGQLTFVDNLDDTAPVARAR